MDKKNLTIALIIIAIAGLLVLYYFTRKPAEVTEQDKIDLLDKLGKESTNTFTNQQKMNILNNLQDTIPGSQ